MGKRFRVHEADLRPRIAAEAARLICDEQMHSLAAASRKAAARFGVSSKRHLPSLKEIEQAVLDYQRLFGGETHEQMLTDMRRSAAEAMRVLSGYQPRLVGPVLSGSAGRHSRVTLHVFTDTPEDIRFALSDAGIPSRLDGTRLRDFHGRARDYPVYAFLAGSQEIEAVVFPLAQYRHAPPDPVDGRAHSVGGGNSSTPSPEIS